LAQQVALARQREFRQVMCGLRTLEFFNNNASVKHVAETPMHEPIKGIRDMSLVDYTKTTGGVYVWMTKMEGATKIGRKLVRFITAGQKPVQRGNHSNAILIWNLQGVVSENNIMRPYNEQFDHGFEMITYNECGLLGLDSINLRKKKGDRGYFPCSFSDVRKRRASSRGLYQVLQHGHI
jgi:hypothetical protein